MGRFKTKFKLNVLLTSAGTARRSISSKGVGKINITINRPKGVRVYFTVCNSENTLADCYLDDKDLERFAVNILKAIKSRHLKP